MLIYQGVELTWTNNDIMKGKKKPGGWLWGSNHQMDLNIKHMGDAV